MRATTPVTQPEQNGTRWNESLPGSVAVQLLRPGKDVCGHTERLFESDIAVPGYFDSADLSEAAKQGHPAAVRGIPGGWRQ